ANPVAKRHGRHTGEGTAAFIALALRAVSSTAIAPGPGESFAGRAVRRAIHFRSRRSRRNPSVTQNATKTSSIDTRDCTKLRFSVASMSPATYVQSTLPNRSHAIMARIATVAVPAAADATRHPN